MFRGVLIFMFSLFAAQSAQAAQFSISGIATGQWYYEAVPWECGAPRCQGVRELSVPFSFITSPWDGSTGYLESSPGRFSFVEYGVLPLINLASGTFQRTANGYVGTSIDGFEGNRNCPPGIGCSISLSATSFEVREISASGSAVPEPSTWAMLIAGLATLGGALRLRRKRPSLALA